MSTWEDIESSYAAAVSKVLPLPRVLVFVLGALGSLVIQVGVSSSVLGAIAAISLSDFSKLSTGILAKADLGNIMWGAFAAFCAMWLSKVLTRISYAVVEKATSLPKRALALDREWVKDLSISERKAAVDLVNVALEDAKKYLKNLTGHSEFTAGVTVVFFAAYYFGNWVDFAVGLAFLILSILAHFHSIKFFLEEYYGQALIRATLEGKEAPTMQS